MVALGVAAVPTTAVLAASPASAQVVAKGPARGEKPAKEPRDRSAPDLVSNLAVVRVTSWSVKLTWENPADTDLARILVRRADGDLAPSNPKKGTEVALGDPTPSDVEDAGLSSSSTYSWAVFTQDTAGNTSTAATVTAATTGAPPTPVGYDVSWPQCETTLPTDPAFAIVGVNGGIATTTNQCLGAQLAWAATSTGQTSQPRVALYVNTANPADQALVWPTSNAYPSGVLVDNPYGTCTDGDDGAACAFMYGYARAYDDANVRGVADPAGYFWWLDVETTNSWQSDQVANRAVLEGMTTYFGDVLNAAGVGIYSTTYQWELIVGEIGAVTSPTTTPGPSNLNGLPSWIAGATTLSGAQSACSGTPLTGGEITVTQYVQDDLDHDYACQ